MSDEATPRRCHRCRVPLTVGYLERQVQRALWRHGGRVLTNEFRAELKAELSPWFDRFAAGEDVCFQCVDAVAERASG